MRTFATVLAFAASALAYQVVAPTNATGFVNDGSNTVSWTKVDTDSANFTIVLVNKSTFPNYEQILDALVVGSLGTIQVNPPATGWPSGTGFQINFVRDSEHLDTILAQSDDFSFHPPTSSSVSGSSSIRTLSQSTTALVVTPTVTPSTTPSGLSSGSGGASGSNDLNPSSTDTSANTQTTNAASAMGVQAAFFGVVALVGALLA